MWMDLRQDVGYAVRMLVRAPGFTLVAIVTLALGIGATTAIFSLANWTILRPVPGVRDPGNVALFWTGSWSGPASFRPSRVSYPNLIDLAPRLTTAADLAAYQLSSVSFAPPGQPPRAVLTHYTTASYFDALGVSIATGRTYIPGEDAPAGGAHLAVISERLWASQFDRSPGVFQRPVQINGLPFTIIGVAPPGFHGPERVGSVDVWLPGSTYPVVNHFPGMRYDDRRSGGFYEFIVRPKPGATFPQVEAELRSLASWLAEQHPAENQKFRETTFHLMGPIGEDGLGRGIIRSLLGLMMLAGVLVLLIACSNVASLLLIRSVGRQEEVAIRTALGAGRFRLVRQHVTEGAILWLLGGSLGALVVWLLTRLVEAGPLIGLRVRDAQVPIDWRVVGFAMALSLIVGISFSLFPSLRAARIAPALTLRGAGPNSSRPSVTAGAALTIIQLAASLTLVVGALLLVATLRHLSNVDLGFAPDGLAAFRVNTRQLGYSEARGMEYLTEFARRLRLVPGVRETAVAAVAPFQGVQSFTRMRPVGDTEPAKEQLHNSVYTPRYFEAVGIPLLRGRVFTEEDLGRPGQASRPVVIVSEGVARRLFGTLDAVGRQVEFTVMGRKGKQFEIIGVVGTARFFSLVEQPESMLYEPAGLDGAFRADATILIRTSGAVDVASEAQTIATALDPALPISRVTPIATAVADARRKWEVPARLMELLAVVASLLAAVGLYGVVAASVAQRRREFGIRMALGARPSAIVGLVLRRTAVIIGLGLLLGLGGAFGLTRVLESRLVGVGRFDPALWSLAAIALIAIAFAAALLPARRATRVNVTETLRAV